MSKKSTRNAQNKKLAPEIIFGGKDTLENKDGAVCSFFGQHWHFPIVEHDTEQAPEFDRMLHASMSKIFGLSPTSMATAWFDWAIHLAAAPGKQAELLQSAVKKEMLLANYLIHMATDCKKPECCVHPLPQDRRFNDEGWNEWPYNVYQQSFLLMEEWCQGATNSVRGISQHHKDIVPFLTRQWLDMFSPLNFPTTNPRVVAATMEQNGMNFVEGAKNFADDIQRQLTGKLPAGTENYKIGENIACTPGKVVYQNRLIELIQYSPTTKEVHAEPVLIVPAWIMKYYILDLSPENSLVKYLVDQGYTVFMISWKNPDEQDRALGFEDYLNLGVMEALNAITTIVPQQKIQAAGYCLGGTLLSIAAAYMAREGKEYLKSITLLAAQVDFEEAGELLLFVDESQLTYLEDAMWQQGYLDKNHMAGAFQMLRSYDLVWSRIVEKYMLGKSTPMNDLMAWNADATRMPYRMHSEYLRGLFLNNDLSEGRFKISGKTISLTDIRAPIFAVSTQRDHVAPWLSVYKIRHFTDTDITFLLTSGGHNAGIVSEPGHPRRSYQVSDFKSTDNHTSPEVWMEQTKIQEGSWWPEWEKWLAKNSSGKTKPPTMSKAICDAPGKYVMEK